MNNNEELVKGYLQAIRVAFDKMIDLIYEAEKENTTKNDLRIRMAQYMADTYVKALRGGNEI